MLFVHNINCYLVYGLLLMDPLKYEALILEASEAHSKRKRYSRM